MLLCAAVYVGISEGAEIYEKFCEIFRTKTEPREVFDLLSAYRKLLTEKTDVSKALIKNTTTGRHRYSRDMTVCLCVYVILR